MEQIFANIINQLGYNHLVCDIFPQWEDVKDEILVPDRKSGTGNGTIHVFLGASNAELQKEFSSYYHAVDMGEDPSIAAIPIKHFFLESNILSMLGYVCQYYYSKGQDTNNQVKNTLSLLSNFSNGTGLLEATSFFKLSTGSSRLRPYFKQFESNGVFTQLIRQLLLPNSGYKISLYKNEKGEYAAFWLIGFKWQTDFEASLNKSLFDDRIITNKKEFPLQQIFYGAPGTGKSHKINEVTEKQPQDNVFRTTFHPDSDYSTFVGCYKPISKKGREQAILDYDSLVDRFKKYISDLGNITHASAAIGYNYHDSIVKMQENSKHTISDLLADAHKSGTTYDTTIRSGMLLYEEQMRLGGNSGKISYEFVPQAFTKAYIKAWQTTEPIFLVIEEINRGNCAQIFGDLFQLLDRKNGVSEYPIKPDTDLGSFIAEKMETPVEGAPESVVRGEEMILPSNLYIWATMNTSDQSLFPIDSAFKRRWDWVYVPIEDAEKGWKIQVNSHEYDWYTFLKSINNEVFDLTHSEDKQLGYFFAKAIDGVIDAKTLVNKVYFYLWTDVFKDYEYESLKAFRKPDGNSAIAFKNFFNKAGIDEVMAEQVLINLGLDNPAETVE